MEYFTGIDFGTSGARLCVIDRDGKVCDQISAKFTDESSRDGSKVWRETLFLLLDQVGREYRRSLRAIAINGTSSTVLLCDDQGQPITPLLLYNDASGQSLLPQLRQFFEQPGYVTAPGRDAVLSATSSLVKLLWWQQQIDQQRIPDRAHYFLHQADWLGWLLHGQLGISDYHNSLKLGYDVATLAYPDWMAAIADSLLPLLTRVRPRVVAPGAVVGPIQADIAQHLQLPSDCQVCAGTTDSIAAFLASGATEPGTAVTSLGSTLVLKLLSETPVSHSAYGIYSHRLGNLWLVGGASNTGGAVLKQFFTATELVDLSAQISPDRPSSLDYYPLPKPGERFPVNDPDLLPRLEPRPGDRVAFLHGLLESMARIEAQGYQRLQELGATPLQQVYTAGGGAANPTWTAIRARQLGVPVMPADQTDAAYGTALLARSTYSPSSNLRARP